MAVIHLAKGIIVIHSDWFSYFETFKAQTVLKEQSHLNMPSGLRQDNQSYPQWRVSFSLAEAKYDTMCLCFLDLNNRGVFIRKNIP